LTSGFGSVRRGPPPMRRRRDEARRCRGSFQPSGTQIDWRRAVRRPWPSDGRPLPVQPPSDSAKSGEVGLRFAISCLCGEVRADQSTQARDAKRRLPWWRTTTTGTASPIGSCIQRR
jgi:hypothetical protein